MKKIILASQSPRRREILNMMQIPFLVMNADVDETMDINNDLSEEIKKVAYKKAKCVFDNHQDCVVIGADTIVVLDNELLGKPKNPEKASEMLKKLSGRTHIVLTGVAILSSDEENVFVQETEVLFDDLSNAEIEQYVESREPLDKAGAYAIQGKGALFVKRIIGDYYSVMGLPINKVYQSIKKYI